MDIQQVLTNIGLSDNEASVYLALVGCASATISDIANTTHMHRPQVYATLASLIEKGLVLVVQKNKRKRYSASPTQKLEVLFSEVEASFYSNIDALHERYKSVRLQRPIVLFSEGSSAVKDAHMDVVTSLKEGDLYRRYMPVATELRKKYIPKGYKELRDRKQLERKIITSAKTKKGSNKLTRSVRAIPLTHDLFEHNWGVTIYGNKVSFVDYESESVITIDHKKFSDFQKKIFDLLFSQLREV